MFSLVIVLIGIAVFSFFMAAGSNYIDGDKIRASEKRAEIHSAVSQYGSGVIQFNVLFGKNPSSISNISPSLIDPPRLPDNVGAVSLQTYTVPSVGSRLGICFSASSVEYSTYLAISDMKTMLPEGQLKITSDCNNLSEITAPIEYPASFNFIYLIRT